MAGGRRLVTLRNLKRHSNMPFYERAEFPFAMPLFQHRAQKTILEIFRDTGENERYLQVESSRDGAGKRWRQGAHRRP